MVTTKLSRYKLIILDRDGVINEDSDAYIKTPTEWQPIVGSLEAVVKLNQTRIKVAVITNQSGVARGYFSLNTLTLIHDKMLTALEKINGHIDLLLYCPHHPNDSCQCRKPKPKLLLEAMQKFAATPEQTLVIGDTLTDLAAADNTNCEGVLLKTGKGEKTLKTYPELLAHNKIFTDLAEAVDFILQK